MAEEWWNVSEESDFSISNIPFGVCTPPGGSTTPRCVTALGNKVVDLSILQDAGAFDDIIDLDANVFSNETLNAYMAHSPDVWPQVRTRLIDLLNGRNDLLRSKSALQKAAFYDIDKVTMHLPAAIGDYTDFYSSREHATNVGTMFRGKDNALQPNWLHLPVGYHGRASTVYVTGQDVVRPYGQLQIDPTDPSKGSKYGPCRLMDFELEVAFFCGGPANTSGPLSMQEAKRRIFGFVLMNDWSARDVQKWEYVPLGPFTAKNFATTISPWIVPTAALESFRVQTSAGTQSEPKPLEYLQDPDYSSYNIQLSVAIRSPTMNEPHVVCQSNFANLYWNAAQQLVHHCVTGCVMNPGDLLASGTISGQTEDSFGSMLELSWKGSRTVELGASGETRKFLQDGDEVIINGFCSRKGRGRVGFGQCSGKVLPAGTRLPQQATLVSRYQNFKLYSYWRSSSSWRVRIALAAKEVPFEVIPVNLKKGEQKNDSFLAINPMGHVPVLEYTDSKTGSVHYLTQSVAIIDFLDVSFPLTRSLIPKDPMTRVTASEIVEVVNAGTQPLQNAPMVVSLEDMSEGKIVAKDFAQNVIIHGLKAVTALVKRGKVDRHGPFATGSFSPTYADCCIIPQLYNARRFGVDVEKDFPELFEIEGCCNVHPWFAAAHPSNQIDAEGVSRDCPNLEVGNGFKKPSLETVQGNE